MLIGREAECSRLVQLLEAVKDGSSAAMVVRGEAGLGKSALLAYLTEYAGDWRVLSAVGVESDMDLAFAGLHQICAPLLGDLRSLPAPQEQALATALGLSDGPPSDRFLVGLAVLTLLSNATEAGPVLCVVDDVQWVDHTSVAVMAFVARRLQAEGTLVVFAETPGGSSDLLSGIPEMTLRGLDAAHSQQLLDHIGAGPLDRQIRERILRETHGNPLALLEWVELSDKLGEHQPGPGVMSPNRFGAPNRIRELYRERVTELPALTQQLLLTASAEPTGDPTLLWRAAELQNIPPSAIAPAEVNEMLSVGAEVTFRHPLLRSTVYWSASPEDRRRAHTALAAATDPGADPDRRAWHRAQATFGTDEEVAGELEQSAERADARGGVPAVATLLQMAVALSAEPASRAHRALAAAEATHLAGDPEAARAMLAAAAVGPLGGLDKALLLRRRGMIALDERRGQEAVRLLLDAARALERLDPPLARETYLEAIRAAMFTGRLGDGVSGPARAARRAALPPAGVEPDALDVLFEGIALRFTDGYASSAPILKRALRALCAEESDDPRWPWMARWVAENLFDDATWNHLATRKVVRARRSGALRELPVALNVQAIVCVYEGDFAHAAKLLEEADAIAASIQAAPILLGSLLLTGWSGDPVRAVRVAEDAKRVALSRTEGAMISFTELSQAILNNGGGRYTEALPLAQSAANRDDQIQAAWSLPELIEAAARADRLNIATSAVEQLAEMAGAAGTDLALGLEARSRALVTSGIKAEDLYREAVARLARTRTTTSLARAHLLYGEWLRREGRRVEGRDQLRAAHDMFAAMGAAGFAERARRELAATGETVRRRTTGPVVELTAQQSQIAQLAVDGHTNSEIGAELFISPRTVEWHLSRVFSQLGVTSRRQLRDALPRPRTVSK